MATRAFGVPSTAAYPVRLQVAAAPLRRRRISAALRIILAIPHLIVVGGPITVAFAWERVSTPGLQPGWSAGGGVLGAVAGIVAVISWITIVFTGRHPDELWEIAAFYLRWRVRASAYLTLLRDEYPPFGDDPYPVELRLPEPRAPRDRLSVALRLVLAIPHLVVLGFIGFMWACVTIAAWFAIVFTGRHPRLLYELGVGALRWTTRVEAYLLLLRDEYPPFTLA